MASPKYERKFIRTKLWLREKYLDIKCSIEQWILLKTANYRLKHSKKVIISSMAYCNAEMTWDDIDVMDEKGRWLPLAFGLCSKKSWEFDNEINERIGEPPEPWRDVVEHPDWTTYYVTTDFISVEQRVNTARIHLKKKVGEAIYDKDIEVKYIFQSQKDLDEATKQYLDWVAAGSPKFKVEFAEAAKESFKEILGEDGAQKLFDDAAKKNAGISEQKIIDKINKDNINKDDEWQNL